MTRIVVDASVAAKWYLPEEHSSNALKLLDPKHRLLAPDLIHAEVGNILWKRQRRGDLIPEEVPRIIDDFLLVPMEIHSSHALLPAAIAIALALDQTVYDSLYVALAVEQNCEFVTADERLAKVLANAGALARIRFLADASS